MSLKKLLVGFIATLIDFASIAQVNLPIQTDRWTIQPDESIEWKIDNQIPHSDHIEMSGQKVSLWMRYGVDSNAKPKFSRTIVFPTFRFLPHETIAHMMYNVEDNDLPRILINNKLLKGGVYNAAVAADVPEKVIRIVLRNGIMEVESVILKDSVRLKRSFFPSTEKPMALERMVFINESKRPAKIEMEYLERDAMPAAEKTDEGPLHFIISTAGDGIRMIQSHDSVEFAVIYQATRKGMAPLKPNVKFEEQLRKDRIKQIVSKLVLETPDTLLNTMFSFAKVRATESIYNTKGGLMHGPGGLRYYAAIWANDQAEYVNPFFAFLGDEIGNRSAMNAYRMFAKYMNTGYNPIPSSIIAEGASTWNGAGDRGDMAMIAYGAGRFALAYGNRDSAKVLWPLIEWCLEYCRRKINNEGVVWSNNDELEGRFPSGNANLNTSSLYYDALRSSAMLGKFLGKPATQLDQYEQQAKQLRINIEKYFGATVEGFKTYRYYKDNDTLRAWIVTPLVMDIFDRKEGTIAALFSPRLWTEDGLASLAGNKTFWDRSTLYGLRGVFAAGETEKALTFLKYYSKRRLLGEHVPYAVEAYPEGNQRHLSAESGLYCRIYTEGMFGIRPTGFNSFDITPRLPKEWNKMAFRNINAFQHQFDIEVTRSGDKLLIELNKNGVSKKYIINNGATQSIILD